MDIISDNNFELPSASCFNSDIRELIQLDKGGNTLGADGRVKENVSFSADIGGQKISATVYREIGIGRNAETPRDAFKRFKSEQRRIPRAVNKEDYERIALETPGLRAELVNVFSKETGKVSVCVKTAGGSLRENEIKNLRKVLFEAKPVGTEIEILTPVIFSARLVISAKTDGWAGERKLTEHIESVFEPLEKRMGALINMPELFKQIGSSPVVSKIKSMYLRLGKGIELTEKDTVKLPEDVLLSLDEIMLQ
ncbi:MAG: baseplate J/gp47 family protein, partial [Oscillospiraceae bacterium]|nr:baseplate J/gp47 family protein [Oscillospiraceae bacterium]